MKKLLALLLALTVVFALAACGSKPADETDAPETEAEKLSAAEVTEADITEPEPTEPEPTESDKNALAIGTVAGSTYTNTYIGITAEFDESWILNGAEDLQDLSGTVVDIVSETDAGKLLSNFTQFFDMMAQNTETAGSINIVYQELSALQQVSGKLTGEEAIIDSLLAQEDVLTSSYEQMGYEVKSMEKVTVSFVGQEHFAIKTSMTLYGIDYYITQLVDYSLGDYAVTITFSTVLEDSSQELMDLFQAL